MTEFARELLVASSLYVVLLIVLGWLGRRARREDSLSDHYLAGRNLGFFVLLLTLFATQYSGNSLSGFPGKTYRAGLAYVMSVTFMVAIVGGYTLFAPRLFRLARDRSYLTPTDFLDDRFRSKTLNALATLIFLFVLGNFLLAQLMAMGHAFSGLTDGAFSYRASILCGAAIILAYELLGGMRAVAWTDALQGGILMIGLTIVAFLLVLDVGGPTAVIGQIAAVAPEKVTPPDLRSCWTWLGNLILLGMGGPLYPQAIQRIYAARRLGDLRRALATMSILPLLAITTVVFIGLCGILLFPGLDAVESDSVTFLVLGHLSQAQPGAHLLILIVMLAVVAAIMSTADSCLLSLGSIVSRDLLGRLRKIPPEEIDRFTRFSPLVSVFVMLLLCLVALNSQTTLWKLLVLKFEILIQLSPAFVLGSRPSLGVTGGHILAGLFSGLWIFALCWSFGLRDVGGFHSGSLAMLINYAVVLVSCRIGRGGALTAA